MIEEANDKKLKKGSKYTAKWIDPRTHEEIDVEYVISNVYENKTLNGSKGAVIIIATGKVKSSAAVEEEEKKSKH